MKLAIKVIAGLLLTMSIVYASCPKERPYGCREGANGKQVCGCGQGW